MRVYKYLLLLVRVIFLVVFKFGTKNLERYYPSLTPPTATKFCFTNIRTVYYYILLPCDYNIDRVKSKPGTENPIT